MAQASVAKPGPKPRSSARTHKLSKTTSGPSRIDNKRQKKIISMVDGYDSTATISVGLRNVLLVWILPGVASIVVGFMGLLAPARSNFASERFSEAFLAISFGSGLLYFVTVIVSIIWAVRTWSNIRRLGKRAKVGVWAVVKRHFGFFVAAIATLVLSFFLDDVAGPLVVSSVVFLGLAMSLVPFLILALVRLFWRTGSPPIGLEEELPHYGLVWFASWFLYSGASRANEYSDLTKQTLSVVVIVSGIACVTAAVTGAKLVMEISRRQDARLASIIGGLELDEDKQQEVTSKQIESAWANSETLVSFDH